MISFTTRNRPKVLEYSLKKTREAYSGEIIVVDDNSETKRYNESICKQYEARHIYNERRLGIPRSKDRGFNELLSYDWQIWLDDDCYLKEGAIERFEEAIKYQGHLLLLKEWAHIKVKKELPNDLISYTGGTACFMTFRKDMYEDVMGFYNGYTKYGHWHGHLSKKMAKYGLGDFVSVKDIDNYLYSFDVMSPPKDFDQHFCSSMSQEDRKSELKSWDGYRTNPKK